MYVLLHPQLSRLGMLCFAIFASTALGADGVPSVLQTRAPPPGLEGLPPVPRGPYHYVILHIIIITVTHRCDPLAHTPHKSTEHPCTASLAPAIVIPFPAWLPPGSNLAPLLRACTPGP